MVVGCLWMRGRHREPMESILVGSSQFGRKTMEFETWRRHDCETWVSKHLLLGIRWESLRLFLFTRETFCFGRCGLVECSAKRERRSFFLFSFFSHNCRPNRIELSSKIPYIAMVGYNKPGNNWADENKQKARKNKYGGLGTFYGYFQKEKTRNKHFWGRKEAQTLEKKDNHLSSSFFGPFPGSRSHFSLFFHLFFSTFWDLRLNHIEGSSNCCFQWLLSVIES